MQIEKDNSTKVAAPKKAAKKKSAPKAKAKPKPAEEVVIKEVEEPPKAPKKSRDDYIMDAKIEAERIMFEGKKDDFHDRKNFAFLRSIMIWIAAGKEPLIQVAKEDVKAYDPLAKRRIKSGSKFYYSLQHKGVGLTETSYEALDIIVKLHQVELQEGLAEGKEPSANFKKLLHILDKKKIVEKSFSVGNMSKQNMNALLQLKQKLEKK